MSATRLRDWTRRVLIVKHREDTAQLELALLAEGFEVEFVMGPYPPGADRFDGSIRCLINHANAWKRVRESGCPTIIVEADFVPVTGFGTLPLPLECASAERACFAYLYACGSVLYGMDGAGHIFGHASSTVAYALTPTTAKLLEVFAEARLQRTDGSWAAWDANLSAFLRREHGVRTYLPLRQYGEHGGVPNPSHKGRVIRGYHQADSLVGRLAFRPHYARGRWHRYALIRARSLLWAWGRLLTLRYFDPRHINASTERGRLAMAAVSFLRLVSGPRWWSFLLWRGASKPRSVRAQARALGRSTGPRAGRRAELG